MAGLAVVTSNGVSEALPHIVDQIVCDVVFRLELEPQDHLEPICTSPLRLYIFPIKVGESVWRASRYRSLRHARCGCRHLSNRRQRGCRAQAALILMAAERSEL